LIYQVLYKASVKKDLRKIDATDSRIIIDGVEKEIAKDPGIGAPLKGEFEGLYGHSIGNCRVIYGILKGSILVLRIALRDTEKE
jgi:mRNA-degrading endonuclease RelE of RelBE toxin-antitoxin system